MFPLTLNISDALQMCSKVHEGENIESVTFADADDLAMYENLVSLHGWNFTDLSNSTKAMALIQKETRLSSAIHAQQHDSHAIIIKMEGCDTFEGTIHCNFYSCSIMYTVNSSFPP